MSCRICLESGDLISVCACRGTQGLVHKECIQRWIDIKSARTCELCLAPYNSSVVCLSSPEDESPKYLSLYLAQITLGCLFNAIAATTIISPEQHTHILSAFCFALVVVYLWNSICKNNIRWGLTAAIVWCIEFIVFSILFRLTDDNPSSVLQIYGMFIMLWAHICCICRSMYDLRVHTNPPPNESHIEV